MLETFRLKRHAKLRIVAGGEVWTHRACNDGKEDLYFFGQLTFDNRLDTWDAELYPHHVGLLEFLHRRGLYTMQCEPSNGGVASFDKRCHAMTEANGIDPSTNRTVNFHISKRTYVYAETSWYCTLCGTRFNFSNIWRLSLI